MFKLARGVITYTIRLINFLALENVWFSDEPSLFMVAFRLLNFLVSFLEKISEAR